MASEIEPLKSQNAICRHRVERGSERYVPLQHSASGPWRLLLRTTSRKKAIADAMEKMNEQSIFVGDLSFNMQ